MSSVPFSSPYAAALAAASLPIDEALPALRAALRAGPMAIVVAPPGAGKTTRVPLALLDEPWAAGQKIILLEPRRLAARAPAARMAASLGEEMGETIGLRVRFEGAVSAKTRIEVVTEGVFVRMILDDPGLSGVAAVLFDEYHERSLDADLGLALALDARILRPDLRLLVMSATLDGARVATLLDGAPVISSQGRAFPVETRYLGRDPTERIEEAVTKAILRALAEETGSILVFLPGQAEIARVAERLAARNLGEGRIIAPLFAAMDRAAQDRAVAPAPKGQRKIVLATSIAETSLTIEGVRVVVDSGLARVPRYEPGLGLTRLETVRVSRASADQRRGRAGRTQPGLCYRLWEEAATGAMEPFGKPAILSADLSGLLLDCAAWGARQPARDLAWLDPPPAPALTEARAMLRAIDALDHEGALTAAGGKIRALALPPRLARMVVLAGTMGEAGLAAEIATIIVERGLGGDSADLRDRVTQFRRDRSPRASDARRLAHDFARQAAGGIKGPAAGGIKGPAAGGIKGPAAGGIKGQAAGSIKQEAAGSRTESGSDLDACGRLLALAFPDRIAKARGKAGEYLMANGRAAQLAPHDALCAFPYLALGEIAGRAAGGRVLLAAPLSEADIATVAGAEIAEVTELGFDPARAALRARRLRRLGALVLAEGNLAVPQNEEAARCLAAGFAGLGIERLPWSPALRQWRERVMFLHRSKGEPWPDLSDQALAADGAPWLVSALGGVTSLAGLSAEQLGQAVMALVPWELTRQLDSEAPPAITTPAGASHRIDYAAEAGPTLSVKVQELFGLATHPSVAGGRVPLVLELLSPAGRPIQITRDLPGFWRGSWAGVRADLRGRYPRHSWPEDPAAALPTLRAKPRGT